MPLLYKSHRGPTVQSVPDRGPGSKPPIQATNHSAAPVLPNLTSGPPRTLQPLQSPRPGGNPRGTLPQGRPAPRSPCRALALVETLVAPYLRAAPHPAALAEPSPWWKPSWHLTSGPPRTPQPLQSPRPGGNPRGTLPQGRPAPRSPCRALALVETLVAPYLRAAPHPAALAEPSPWWKPSWHLTSGPPRTPQPLQSPRPGGNPRGTLPQGRPAPRSPCRALALVETLVAPYLRAAPHPAALAEPSPWWKPSWHLTSGPCWTTAALAEPRATWWNRGGTLVEFNVSESPGLFWK